MHRLAFASLAACLAAGAAHAQEMRPGLWQYTMTMNIPGMPAGAGPQSHSVQHCVTPKDVQDKSAFRPKGDDAGKCAISDFRQQGNQFSYTIACKGEMSMTGAVKGSHTADTMTVDMDMKLTPAREGMSSIKQSMTAKRIGDCK